MVTDLSSTQGAPTYIAFGTVEPLEPYLKHTSLLPGGTAELYTPGAPK